VELSVRFLKPVEVGQSVRVSGRVVEVKGRVVETEGEILGPQDQVAARGRGRFLKM
jgi:acyl-coenzyme A thioesterase PaaI-like protein